MLTRAEWISALRSGDFKQGVGFLKQETADGFAYCCLGVACEVANLKWTKQDGDILYVATFPLQADEEEAGYAPATSVDTLEGNIFSDRPLPHSVEVVLQNLNDYNSFTFIDISDWLESLSAEDEHALTIDYDSVAGVQRARDWKASRDGKLEPTGTYRFRKVGDLYAIEVALNAPHLNYDDADTKWRAATDEEVETIAQYDETGVGVNLGLRTW